MGDAEVSTIAGYIQISRELLRDQVKHLYDRWMRPWLFPDANPMPFIDLFPTLTRAQEAAEVAQSRVRTAWAVLLGRVAIDDEENDW